MADKSALGKIVDLAEEFVIARKGEWGHEDWEGFLGEVSTLKIDLTDETKRNLGNILEACKYFYAIGMVVPTARPAKPKAKAKPKSK